MSNKDVEITPDLPTEPYYTPQQIAKTLNGTPQTAARIFRKIEGTIEFGSDETRYKRKRKFVRVPKSVLERFLAERRTVKP